jgi:virginiamycin B lyase
MSSIVAVGGPITEFAFPRTNAQTQGIATGPDGALWFTETAFNKIGYVTPAGDVKEFRLPTVNAGAYNIAAGPDGALWFTEGGDDSYMATATSGASPPRAL